MPQFSMDRKGSGVPLLRVPPRGASIGETGEAIPPIEIFVQIGHVEAGCVICKRPIPANTTRICFVSTTYAVGDGGRYQQKKYKYFIHPACLTKPMGNEVQRHGLDCWDCGASGRNQAGLPTLEDFVFTTSKFAYGRLCSKCTKKPRWKACVGCDVYYPQFMVVYGVTAKHNVDDAPWSLGEEEYGEWCPSCAELWEVETKEDTQEHRVEWEELRQKILTKGVFDDGESS